MANVYYVTALWTGFTGSPGYSRFAFDGLIDPASLNSAGASIRAFFEAIKGSFLPTWTIQVQGAVPYYDAATGALVGESTMSTVPAATTGTATAGTPWANGAGAMVAWKTGVIFAGHRIQGRTFLVPMVGVADTDGTLTTAAMTNIGNAASALIASQQGKFSIWGKQWDKQVPPQQLNGIVAHVASYVVRDKTGILRSRRD